MGQGRRGRYKREIARQVRRRKAREGEGFELPRSPSPRPVPSPPLQRDVAVLNLIAAQKRTVRQAEADLTKMVRRARRLGVTWERIGQALGVTRQSASLRWGPYPIDSPPGKRGGRAARRPKGSVKADLTKPARQGILDS